ncbi:MAG: hypothetical protein DWH80_09680 [Planctomycetota bacterium]|nr:MAG: hypothetical protein DWH80_09680 [Planctomycetota bacterium]
MVRLSRTPHRQPRTYYFPSNMSYSLLTSLYRHQFELILSSLLLDYSFHSQLATTNGPRIL